MARSKKTARTVLRDRGDVITVSNKGNSNAIAAGRGAKAVISRTVIAADMDAWRKDMERRIDALRDLLPADKTDLKDNVAKVVEEASKGKQAKPARLERLLNVIGEMAPDIFDVAITTLASPLAGLGLVVKKIGEKAKLEARP